MRLRGFDLEKGKHEKSGYTVVLPGALTAIVSEYWSRWWGWASRHEGKESGKPPEETNSGLSTPPVEADENYHEGETLYLSLLADEQAMIRDKVFVRCTLKGPAVIVPLGDLNILSNAFQGAEDPDAFLWEIEGDRVVVGAIGITNCSFRECTFWAVGLAGTPETIEMLRRGFINS